MNDISKKEQGNVEAVDLEGRGRIRERSNIRRVRKEHRIKSVSRN